MEIQKLQRLETIPITLPERWAYIRLGYRKGKTDISEEQRDAILLKMKKAFTLCKPTGVYGILDIVKIENGTIYLSDGSDIYNLILAEKLQGCRAVWIGAATIGPAIAAYCHACFQKKRGSDAAVADAVGSESVEKAIGFLQHYASTQLMRRGLVMTNWRFSPGYSDWSLKDELKFDSWLNLGKMGVSLTESYILQPEKTVTAIAGLR
ncbi:MAG: hypothetical protein WCS73_11795 [Lentisphaeria bacterium]